MGMTEEDVTLIEEDERSEVVEVVVVVDIVEGWGI